MIRKDIIFWPEAMQEDEEVCFIGTNVVKVLIKTPIMKIFVNSIRKEMNSLIFVQNVSWYTIFYYREEITPASPYINFMFQRSIFCHFIGGPHPP